jgi:soluble lytic murein transglycosylase-like protein
LESPTPLIVAARIAEGFRLVRTARSGAEVVRGARLVQVGTIQLMARPDWRRDVLDRLAPPDRASMQADLAAGDELVAVGEPARADLPHWQIVPAATPDTLRGFYDEAQRAYGVPWQFLAAINLVETSMGRIRGLSRVGAMGPMQFMPQTWAHYGSGDVNDPHDAIMAAARYLKAAGAAGDLDRALYAYNPSTHYVRAVDVYAQQFASDPRAFARYYNRQVYVGTSMGLALLPEGWSG